MDPRERTHMALQAAVWETESTQEMFDFENNKNVKFRDFRIDNSNDVYMANADSKTTKCIVVKSGVYNENLYCGRLENHRGIWNYTPGGLIDSYKVAGFEDGTALQAGGLIRIGRMQYFIRETFDGFSSKI